MVSTCDPSAVEATMEDALCALPQKTAELDMWCVSAQLATEAKYI
jgi:hypothetical protein